MPVLLEASLCILWRWISLILPVKCRFAGFWSDFGSFRIASVANRFRVSRYLVTLCDAKVTPFGCVYGSAVKLSGFGLAFCLKASGCGGSQWMDYKLTVVVVVVVVVVVFSRRRLRLLSLSALSGFGFGS